METKDTVITEGHRAFKEGTILLNQYKIIKEAGSGSFGTVFKAENIENKEIVAIKLENDSTEKSNEIDMYKKLQTNKGFPSIFRTEIINGRRAIIMEYLGLSLDDLFKFCNNKFSLKTVITIALQALNRIETLHENGIIHRDIKPDNFLIGYGKNKDKIYLIDFGLSKYYIQNGVHIPYGKHNGFIGSYRYSSIRNHHGIEQSRRDDLESLGYMLIYFLKGVLPWQGLKESTKSKKSKQISNIKTNMPLNELCEGLPKEFGIYMKYCRRLDFHQPPDYKFLRKLFINLFQENKYELDYVYDWNIVALNKHKSMMLQEKKKAKNERNSSTETNKQDVQDNPIQTQQIINDNSNQATYVKHRKGYTLA
jgi:serine/threonine protein kinase